MWLALGGDASLIVRCHGVVTVRVVIKDETRVVNIWEKRLQALWRKAWKQLSKRYTQIYNDLIYKGHFELCMSAHYPEIYYIK